MNFKGKAKRLEDMDLPMVGREIGVGEDEVHAILDVESAGSGFDSQGRPKMLFEPHIFWRELKAGPKRDKAAAQGLAYPQWKRNYPKDSYPRLLKAITIDEDAALRSASWGLGQIMGFNCVSAGYATAKSMVLAFMDDEEHHLRAMINFIRANGLDDELRRHDWKGFARGYNGAGFAKNGYDKKLAAAFAKWQRIKDTPIPTHVKETPKTEHVAPVVLTPTQAQRDRADLAALGYTDVKAFQRNVGLTPDGIIGPKTRAKIAECLAHPMSKSIPPPTTSPKPSGVAPATIVAAIVGLGYAVWQWGADLIDKLTFWN
jgi:N-acetylmuramidase/Putative peptidoglycan binding domain